MPNKLKYSIERGLYVKRDVQAVNAAMDRGDRSRHMSSISSRPKKRWFYSGDVNLENGGFFYNLDNWQYNYVEAWRVVPYSDAGGHDNQFWLEELTVNIREPGPQLDSILGFCGYKETIRIETPRRRRHLLVDAHAAYGAYDQGRTRVIQIGPRPDEFYGGREEPLTPEIVLRSGTDLKKWLRKRVNEL